MAGPDMPVAAASSPARHGRVPSSCTTCRLVGSARALKSTAVSPSAGRDASAPLGRGGSASAPLGRGGSASGGDSHPLTALIVNVVVRYCQAAYAALGLGWRLTGAPWAWGGGS